ncbi:DUF3077 domain-containing protein [Pseudomonas sp. R5(2019)]|uniref:DUF3077 domain-containing protein n=1 Tax=Pseudomonas sp. R5(2019) TaxID=2697566 RepID=UPI001413742F|nr:DUF3077 domain-containing protein [Pseudomonas sp. R5(2019)]
MTTIHSKTATATFTTCNGSHDPLFAVREGVALEDALVHITNLLTGIEAVSHKACEHTSDSELKGLLWSNLHSAEAARSLAEALLDGMEEKALKQPCGLAE